MGYKTKDIADITEPKIVSLSGLPNFATFTSKKHTSKKLELNLTVKLVPGTTASIISVIRIVDPLGAVHTFSGTTSPNDVSGNVFFISTIPGETAENIKTALLADRWIATNFDVVIPFIWVNGNPTNGNILNIKSKGTGKEFNIELTAPNDINSNAYIFNWVNKTSTNGDTISGEASTAEIELDVYTDTGVFLGEDDRAISTERLGTPVTSLQKTYAGSPVWFELNAMFANSIGYNFPSSSGWFDTGTIKDIRFIAKVKAYNSYPFYQSNVLYVLNGRAQLDSAPDLDEYVYADTSVKLLTHKPRTNYVRGQKAYLNFILSDPLRQLTTDNYELRIVYRVYTQSGRYLGIEYKHPVKRLSLAIVNTCVLDIDSVLNTWPTAGLVKVALARGNALISDDLEYNILPDCLHTLRQFSFINTLGGWDCFNFDAASKTDLKQTTETYNKTVTPNYQNGDSVETVYTSEVEKTYTIESAPISDEVAAWLEELAAATTVLDGENRYIIKEEFNLQFTADKKNMQRATIKYRLSE